MCIGFTFDGCSRQDRALYTSYLYDFLPFKACTDNEFLPKIQSTLNFGSATVELTSTWKYGPGCVVNTTLIGLIIPFISFAVLDWHGKVSLM